MQNAADIIAKIRTAECETKQAARLLNASQNHEKILRMELLLALYGLRLGDPVVVPGHGKCFVIDCSLRGDYTIQCVEVCEKHKNGNVKAYFNVYDFDGIKA